MPGMGRTRTSSRSRPVRHQVGPTQRAIEPAFAPLPGPVCSVMTRSDPICLFNVPVATGAKTSAARWVNVSYGSGSQ